MKNTVGELRAQCAYQDGSTPIELVSKDPAVAHILAKLRVVQCYPDTTNAAGEWSRTFKIEDRFH